MTTRNSKPRAVSKESKLLSQSENAYILQNLQNRQLAQATAVVQLLEADGVTWRLIDAGALCFIKDSTRRSYFLNFFRIQQQRQQPLWEHEVYENINIIKQRPFFIQFSATNKQMGLNFADQSEANEVFELIKEKSR